MITEINLANSPQEWKKKNPIADGSRRGKNKKE